MSCSLRYSKNYITTLKIQIYLIMYDAKTYVRALSGITYWLNYALKKVQQLLDLSLDAYEFLPHADLGSHLPYIWVCFGKIFSSIAKGIEVCNKIYLRFFQRHFIFFKIVTSLSSTVLPCNFLDNSSKSALSIWNIQWK